MDWLSSTTIFTVVCLLTMILIAGVLFILLIWQTNHRVVQPYLSIDVTGMIKDILDVEKRLLFE